jgi:predicted peptidase
MLARALTVTLLGLSACGGVRFVPDKAGGFVEKQTDHRYFVYLPKDWSAEKKWPVIVYLHGGDERGSDGVKPTQVGLGPVVHRSQGTFPFIVVFPQVQRGNYWGMPDSDARAMKALDDVIRDHSGDPRRVTLTGNSLGGYGTWFMGALHPERFAALVPICGGVRGRAPKGAPFAHVPSDDRPRAIAQKIGKTPVWAFHGARDWLIPPANSRELVEELKKAGGNVRYTEYPDAGHNAWDKAYAEKALWEWLGQQSRP